MKNRRFRASLLALAGLLSLPLATAPAWAAAGAEAKIFNLTYTLEDLDLADGIVPAFSIVNDVDVNRLRTELTANVENTLLGTSDNGISADFSFIAALDLTRSVVGNEAIAQTDSTTARAWVLSTAKGRAAAFASAESNLTFADNFGLRLTPHTRLTISAQATVTAFDTGAPDALGAPFEFAMAESFLRVRAADPGDGSGAQDTLSKRSAATAVDALADAVDDSGALSVSFQNLSAADLYGYLSVRSTASANGVTPAVPEPSTVLMALSGLALLAAARRRAGARGNAV